MASFVVFLVSLCLIGDVQSFSLNVASSGDNYTIGKQIRLTDLNIDCKLLIIDQLDLLSLINLAETNEHFFILTADVFRRTYSLTQIISPFFHNIEDHVHAKDDIVSIQHFETARSVLRLFGHLITNIQIKYHSIFRSSAKEINELINLCCSESLRQIDVHSIQDDFFQDMTTPFKRVETVSILGHFKSLGSDQLDFGELFPAMRNLSLEDIQVSDTSVIDREFAHLEHLYIYIWKYDDQRRFSELDVEKIIKKNPQIKSLALGHSTRSTVKLANELLPNLESLTLVYYTEYSFEIHPEIVFKRVKSFTIEKSSHSVPKNITFKQLTKFQTDSSPEECNRWIELVEKSTQLKKLHVRKGLISNTHLQRLASNNLYLNEVALICRKDVNDETIISFVENNENVMKIELTKNAPGLLSPVAKTFRKYFGKDWTINESEYKISLDKSEK